jgi:hypothetical protein
MLIGDLDVTDFVFNFSLESPALEMNAIATWHGSFEVRYNEAARAAGLTPGDFSEQSRPDRWREGQQAVAITIMGLPLPIVRIDADYAYDSQIDVGKGRFYQFLDILAGDRPNINPDIKIGAQVPLGWVVEKLIDEAMVPARLKRVRTIAGVSGVLDAPLSTRDPIRDAQIFCGVNLRWLTVDKTETIITVSGEPASHSILFARSIDEVIFEPNRQSIHEVGEKFIVTGARQVPDIKPKENCPPNPNVDEFGRTKRVPKDEMAPFKVVFPGPYSMNPILSRRTTTMFSYRNPATGFFRSYIETIGFELTGFDGYDLAQELNTASMLNTKDFDENTAVQTVIVTEEPAGKIFPRLGTNQTIRVSELVAKTPFVETTWVPVGLLRPELGDDFTLALKSRNVVTGQRNDRKCGGGTDPKTGRTITFSDRPQQEPQQMAPEIPLKTEPLKGTCTITPIGWTPIISNPKPIAIGFIPDQEHADRIACYLAAREVGRRDQHFLTMPIANCTEWLMAGCPIVGKVRIHDGDFIFDSVIIKYDGKSASLGMTCSRLNQISPIVPPPAKLRPYTPAGNLQIIAPTAIDAIAGAPYTYSLAAVGG